MVNLLRKGGYTKRKQQEVESTVREGWEIAPVVIMDRGMLLNLQREFLGA